MLVNLLPSSKEKGHVTGQTAYHTLDSRPQPTNISGNDSLCIPHSSLKMTIQDLNRRAFYCLMVVPIVLRQNSSKYRNELIDCNVLKNHKLKQEMIHYLQLKTPPEFEDGGIVFVCRLYSIKASPEGSINIWDLLVRLRDTENVNIIASTEDL